MLRHNIHIDACKVSIPNGGLDPRYRELHGRGDAQGIELEEIKAVTNEAMRDVLDAVSYLLKQIGPTLTEHSDFRLRYC